MDGKEVSVYDLLADLDADTYTHGVQLIVLAGKYGWSNGYFFVETSAEYLKQLTAIEIFESDGTYVGTIDNQFQFYELFVLGNDPRFNPKKSYLVGKPEISAKKYIQLVDIRDLILKTLKRRGDLAVKEYALIGDMIGGKAITPEEAQKKILNLVAKLNFE